MVGRWEAEESDLLRALLRPGATFVDVGACVGYMTLLGAKAVGPAGRVVAVEPSPANVALLRANVAANGATNVEFLAAAASEHSGSIGLSLSPWNTGDNRAYPVPEMERVEVAAVRLDDVLRHLERVDVVKVDTQGTDHRAIRGLAATLARCRPVLVVEFWPLGISESGDDPLAVLEEYAALGYEVRVLGGDDRVLGTAADHAISLGSYFFISVPEFFWAIVRDVDSSLLDEWERMRDPTRLLRACRRASVWMRILPSRPRTVLSSDASTRRSSRRKTWSTRRAGSCSAWCCCSPTRCTSRTARSTSISCSRSRRSISS